MQTLTPYIQQNHMFEIQLGIESQTKFLNDITSIFPINTEGSKQ